MSYEEEEQRMAEREALFDEQQMESERYKELEYISSIPIVDLIQNPHVKKLVEALKLYEDYCVVVSVPSSFDKTLMELKEIYAAKETLAEWGRE